MTGTPASEEEADAAKGTCTNVGPDLVILDDTDHSEHNRTFKPAALEYSSKWTAFVYWIHEPILRLLLFLSRLAVKNPWICITATISLSCSFLVVGLATNFEEVADRDSLWTPFGARPKDHGDWIKKESGYIPKPRYFSFLIHADGRNVLGQEGVGRSLEALDTVRNIPGYDELCSKAERKRQSTCQIWGITQHWNHSVGVFNQSVGSDEDAILTMSSGVYPNGEEVDYDGVLGLWEKENEVLTYAESYSLSIYLPAGDDILDEVESFESVAIDTAIDLQNSWAAEGENNMFRLEVYCERSFADEFSRAVLEDIPLVAVAFTIMSIFCVLVFWKNDKVQSRSLVGFGAVCTVLLSIMTGYGLAFMIGVPFTGLAQILPFVMFGIGLDDSFIIFGAYERIRENSSSVTDRIHDTVKETGMSIFLTTFTSTLAFAVGCISTIPAVYWLCLYAFPTIIIDFVYQVTFFLAIIALDEKRVKDGRMDGLVCITPKDRHEETREAGVQIEQSDTFLLGKFMAWYSDILLRPLVKAGVLVLFSILLAAMMYSTTQLERAFVFTDVLPKDSYVTSFINAVEDYSHNNVFIPEIHFRYVNQSDVSVQASMESFLEDMVKMPQISDLPQFFWLWDFRNFTNKTSSVNNLNFEDQIAAFLDDPLYGKLYENDIVRDNEGTILASRVYMKYDALDINSVAEKVDALESQRDICKSQGVNKYLKDWAFFTWERAYYIWEFYAVSIEELILTTIVGVASVGFAGFLFIPHWSAFFFVTPLVSILYIDLLGILQLAGIYINAVTYIGLTMSIGLMVDYLMHILLRYYESVSSNRNEKVKDMLCTIGSSVLLGGISTLLGVLPLAFSNTAPFWTLFVTFLGLVGLGIGHGLILLPVILSLIGPV